MAQSLPLCVDLDGTITYTDTIAEAFFMLFKKNPLTAFSTIFWLRSGKGSYKHALASKVELLVDTLPYNEECLRWLAAEKKRGRTIYLVTGTNEKFAHLVADHLGIFDGVIASTKDRVMTHHDKSKELVERFGDKGFAYAGNSAADIAVWKHAGERILVNTPARIAKAAQAFGAITKIISPKRTSIKFVLRAIRWHQWSKNLLLFVPMITSHRVFDSGVFVSALIGFASFSAIASSIYLFNDLVDLPADRKHPYKKYRPIAAGTLSIHSAIALGVLLVMVSFLLALTLPTQFLYFILLYIALNLAYSLRLKKIVGIDVLLIASLYVLRMLAGSVATNIVVSSWLFVFGACIFLGLALVKRTSEIRNLQETGKKRAAGRGYDVEHYVGLVLAGKFVSYGSLAILGLYIHSPAVTPLYEKPILLWFLLPMFALWIHRVWNLTTAGNMHEDPTEFAAKDLYSYITFAASLFVVLLAS